MAGPTTAGEQKAWELLALLRPEDVVRTAGVTYDAASACYTIRSFGMDFSISRNGRTITSHAPESDLLLERQGDFFRLSVLWYLVHAKEMNTTGRLVKLQNIRGGDIFAKGSHVLPLDAVAAKYGKNKEVFLERGRTLGGEVLAIADASFRLYPLPKIPMILTLWLADEEFPSRADILLDSTGELQAPTDILWSLAVMTLGMMA